MMKKLLFLGIWVIFAQLSQGQVMVGDVDINTLDIQYIEVHAAIGIGGVVRINYGQQPSGPFSNFDPLRDREENTFKNDIAALNYLYLNGWELFQPTFQKGDESAPSYLLQRRKE
ncbi:MAG: hypothetical protein H6563_09490 [Lewinellaceae bacterium]|nr:hypothetical protein [Lewinellaceae bacterium]